MTRERRRWERLESNLFAAIRRNGSDEKIGRGVVVDVHLHGFGLESETDLEIGDTFEFDIEIPFSIQAKVVRSITPGQLKRYGLEFVGQGLFDKLLLKKLLKRRDTIKLDDTK